MTADRLNFTKIRINTESRIQMLIIYFWIYSSFISYGIVFGCRILGIGEQIAHILIRCFTVLIVLLALQSCFVYIKLRHLLFYIVIFGLYMISYRVYPLNAGAMDNNFSLFFLSVLPLFFLGAMLGKVRIPYETLLMFSRCIIVFFLLLTLLFSDSGTGDYEMGKAYNCLPSIMLVSYSFLKEEKLQDIFFVILGIAFLLICATRGPILLYAIFMLLQLFFLKRQYRYVYGGALILLLVLFFSPIGRLVMEGILSLMDKMGFNTRIFDMFLSRNLTDDNGRNWLTDAVFAMISRQPWRGNGIFSDRRATAAIGIGGTEGSYVHNLIYEFWCDFGYALGTILLLLLVFAIIKILKGTAKDANFKIIFSILALCYIGKLFMSSSFLIEPGFWLCIGVCYEGMFSNRKRKRIRICV
ncbi:O-antigen ligase family protein [uncultured Merdimonas sp.]|uniref:O-antigen ligase family protein n=1 Tax=uncultured Merdimonas sp. TaxID=2023269 RepID=UPI003208E66E